MRLSRTGAKKTPLYRLVVADSRMPRDGRFIERIGNYDPRGGGKKAVVNGERALYWLKQGARPSDTVRQILTKEGVWQKFKQK